VVYHLTVDQDLEPPVYPRPAGMWVIPPVAPMVGDEGDEAGEAPPPTRTVQLQTKPVDLSELLQVQMSKEPTRLEQCFQQLDATQTGALTREQVGQLLVKMLPKVEKSQLTMFHSLLEVSGDGSVTYAELLARVQELSEARAMSHSTLNEGATQPELRRIAELVGDAEISLGDAESSLGDAESSLGDA
jgi:hypothetical protein